MPRSKVLVTRRLPPSAMTTLGERFELIPHEGIAEANKTLHPESRWRDGPAMPRSRLLELVADADGLLCLLTDRIDAELLAAAPRLRVVANYAVGFNNVDVSATRSRRIAVTNTPGVLTESTADFAWALLMATARRVGEGDRLIRTGRWDGWKPLELLGTDVSGTTLGIIGLGRIGQAMARRAAGFDMRIVGWSRTRREDRDLNVPIEQMDLDDVCRKSDYLSIHTAYSNETHHLIDDRRLDLMKPNAILINTARGACIDEAALVEAIKHGNIASAGLDVYEREPEVHPGLRDHPQVVLAPHLGSATRGTRNRMAEIAIENLTAVLSGQPPLHPVPGSID